VPTAEELQNSRTTNLERLFPSMGDISQQGDISPGRAIQLGVSLEPRRGAVAPTTAQFAANNTLNLQAILGGGRGGGTGGVEFDDDLIRQREMLAGDLARVFATGDSGAIDEALGIVSGDKDTGGSPFSFLNKPFSLLGKAFMNGLEFIDRGRALGVDVLDNVIKEVREGDALGVGRELLGAGLPFAVSSDEFQERMDVLLGRSHLTFGEVLDRNGLPDGPKLGDIPILSDVAEGIDRYVFQTVDRYVFEHIPLVDGATDAIGGAFDAAGNLLDHIDSRDVLGFAGDVALDPLSYLAGASMLTKGWKTYSRVAFQAGSQGDTLALGLGKKIAQNRGLWALADDELEYVGKLIRAANPNLQIADDAFRRGLRINVPGTGVVARTFTRRTAPKQVFFGGERIAANNAFLGINRALGRTRATVARKFDTGRRLTNFNGANASGRAMLWSDDAETAMRGFLALDSKGRRFKQAERLRIDVDGFIKPLRRAANSFGGRPVDGVDAMRTLGLGQEEGVKFLRSRGYDKAEEIEALLRQHMDSIRQSAIKFVKEQGGDPDFDMAYLRNFQPSVAGPEEVDEYIRRLEEAIAKGAKDTAAGTGGVQLNLQTFENRQAWVVGQPGPNGDLLLEPGDFARRHDTQALTVREQILQQFRSMDKFTRAQLYETDLWRALPIYHRQVSGMVERELITGDLRKWGIADDVLNWKSTRAQAHSARRARQYVAETMQDESERVKVWIDAGGIKDERSFLGPVRSGADQASPFQQTRNVPVELGPRMDRRARFVASEPSSGRLTPNQTGTGGSGTAPRQLALPAAGESTVGGARTTVSDPNVNIGKRIEQIALDRTVGGPEKADELRSVAVQARREADIAIGRAREHIEASRKFRAGEVTVDQIIADTQARIDEINKLMTGSDSMARMIDDLEAQYDQLDRQFYGWTNFDAPPAIEFGYLEQPPRLTMRQKMGEEVARRNIEEFEKLRSQAAEAGRKLARTRVVAELHAEDMAEIARRLAEEGTLFDFAMENSRKIDGLLDGWQENFLAASRAASRGDSALAARFRGKASDYAERLGAMDSRWVVNTGRSPGHGNRNLWRPKFVGPTPMKPSQFRLIDVEKVGNMKVHRARTVAGRAAEDLFRVSQLDDTFTSGVMDLNARIQTTRWDAYVRRSSREAMEEGKRAMHQAKKMIEDGRIPADPEGARRYFQQLVENRGRHYQDFPRLQEELVVDIDNLHNLRTGKELARNKRQLARLRSLKRSIVGKRRGFGGSDNLFAQRLDEAIELRRLADDADTLAEQIGVAMREEIQQIWDQLPPDAQRRLTDSAFSTYTIGMLHREGAFSSILNPPQVASLEEGLRTVDHLTMSAGNMAEEASASTAWAGSIFDNGAANFQHTVPKGATTVGSSLEGLPPSGQARRLFKEFRENKDNLGESMLNEAMNEGYTKIGWNAQIPDDVASVLEDVSKLKHLDSGFWRTFDWMTNTFKAQALFSPGFHFRNMMGGMFNNHLAGVDIKSYGQFWNAYRQYQKARWGKGALNRLPKASIEDALQAVKNPKSRARLKDMIDSGILTGGQSAEVLDLIEYSAGTRRGLFKRFREKYGALSPLSPTFKPYQWNILVGGEVENMLRGTLMWDTLAKGGTLDDAIDGVWKYHFDYDDLSTIERSYARRAIPFYTWTRKNLPLMLESMFRNPRAFNKWNMLKQNLEYGVEDSEYPSWLDDGIFIHLVNSSSEDYYVRPDLPFNRLAEAFSPDQLASNLNPIIRIPLIELPADRRLDIEAPLDRDKLVEIPKSWYPLAEIASVMGPLADGIGFPQLAERTRDGKWLMTNGAVYTIRNWLPILGRIRNFTSEDPRDKERYMGRALSMMFGIGLEDVTAREVRNMYIGRSQALDKLVEDLEAKGELADDGRRPQVLDADAFLRSAGLGTQADTFADAITTEGR
jgi:hypothetical protein